MADFLLKEDGAFLLLETGDKLILEEVVVEVGGPSGGRSKPKGYKVVTDELGTRPVKHSPSLSTAKLRFRSESISIGSLQFTIRSFVESIVRPHFTGIATGLVQIKQRSRTSGRIIIQSTGESVSDLEASYLMSKMIKEIRKFGRFQKLNMLYNSMESMDEIFTIKQEQIKSFEFDESAEEWQGILTEQRFRAFTQSSSFVGNVRYDRDEQSMRILLNGIPYQFCNVPESVFDSFEGANSKGAFFNRIIKTQFDC